MEDKELVHQESTAGKRPPDSISETYVPDKGKEGPKIYFFIIAIVALLATNIYFYVKYKHSDEVHTTILSEKAQMETELDRIEVELDRVTQENVELTDALKSAQEGARVKIEELRAKLTQHELTRAELTRAQQEISQLRITVSRYTKDIERLKNENALLVSERDRLKATVNDAQQKADELAELNNELEHKVDLASALKLSSININAIRTKKNGDESMETKAKRTDKLRIDFTIADNALAKKAIYDIYLRVIEPNGNLVITDNHIFEIDGVEMQYTDRTAIEFSNDGKLYSYEWGGIPDFKSGTYIVVLYTNKGTLGKGTIRLN